MDNQVEVCQLRRAREIAELSSVNGGAERLHIIQPALITDIKQFQDALCVHLFLIGSGQRLRLTRAARPLSVLLEEIEGTIEECTEVLTTFRNGHVSVLQFGCGSFVDLNLCQTACVIFIEAIHAGAIKPVEGDAGTNGRTDVNQGRLRFRSTIQFT